MYLRLLRIILVSVLGILVTGRSFLDHFYQFLTKPQMYHMNIHSDHNVSERVLHFTREEDGSLQHIWLKHGK